MYLSEFQPILPSISGAEVSTPPNIPVSATVMKQRVVNNLNSQSFDGVFVKCSNRLLIDYRCFHEFQ